MWRVVNRVVEVAAVVVVMVALFKAGEWLTEATWVPIHVTGVQTMNSPVKAGNELQVRVYREKVRDCPVSSQRRIQDIDGRTVASELETWRGDRVGTTFLDLLYNTSSLPPGHYTLYVTTYHTCPDDTYEVVQDPLQFRVVP
jgi:hypothetical protein